jgi:hypothetical protein
MRSSLTRVTAITATTGALLLAGIVTAGAANATPIVGADAPSVTTIAPGAQSATPWTYKNTGSTENSVTSFAATFTAPAHTTFAPQTQVTTQYSSDGVTWVANALVLGNCTLSGGNTALNCTSSNPVAIGWPTGGFFRLNPVLAMNANAPGGQTFSSASHISFTNAGTAVTIDDGTLSVKTPLTGPTFSSADNSSGSTVINGTGVPGAVVEIKDASGTVVGTATAASDGTFAVVLNKDYSGSADDLTMTQTVGGVVSPTTTIAAADLPIINLGIAAGAGLAALLTAAVFIMRKRRA